MELSGFLFSACEWDLRLPFLRQRNFVTANIRPPLVACVAWTSCALWVSRKLPLSVEKELSGSDFANRGKVQSTRKNPTVASTFYSRPIYKLCILHSLWKRKRKKALFFLKYFFWVIFFSQFFPPCICGNFFFWIIVILRNPMRNLLETPGGWLKNRTFSQCLKTQVKVKLDWTKQASIITIIQKKNYHEKLKKYHKKWEKILLRKINWEKIVTPQNRVFFFFFKVNFWWSERMWHSPVALPATSLLLVLHNMLIEMHCRLKDVNISADANSSLPCGAVVLTEVLCYLLKVSLKSAPTMSRAPE